MEAAESAVRRAGGGGHRRRTAVPAVRVSVRHVSAPASPRPGTRFAPATPLRFAGSGSTSPSSPALSPRSRRSASSTSSSGAAASIADGEIARATSSMIIRLLEAESPPAPAEIVAVFATSTCSRSVVTELGSADARRIPRRRSTAVTEDDMRELIEARVASLKIEGDSVDADALEAAIDDVLEFTRRVIYERPSE